MIASNQTTYKAKTVIFYIWDYRDYVRALETGYTEFKTPGERRRGDEFPICPHCGARIGTLPWLPPYIIKLTTKKLGDLCTDGLQLLVSRRFRDAWDTCGLTGLEFVDEPIQVQGRIPDTVDYRLVRPVNAITRLDEEASGFVLKKLVGCDQCRFSTREKVDRLRIDESSWAGLDVFEPSGLCGNVIVTSRFVEMIEKYELTNFHFIHQDDYFYPTPMPSFK